MASLTVLQLVAAYARQRGLPVPSTMFTSTDTGVLQLMEIVNKAGRDIVRRRGWVSSSRRKTFACLGTEDQGVLATILGEDPENVSVDTLFNDTQKLPIQGPLSDKEYQNIKANLPTGPLQCYKIFNGHLFITGGLTVGDEIALMYKSRNWLQTAVNAGGSLSAIAADTNVPVFSDNLMLLAMDYHWRKEKNLDYQTQLSAFVLDLLDAPSAGILRMDEGSPDSVKPGIVVPIGNWSV